MLGPEGGGLWDLTSVEEENKTFFVRVWKPIVLKTLRRSLKQKAQKRQYPLQVSGILVTYSITKIFLFIFIFL